MVIHCVCADWYSTGSSGSGIAATSDTGCPLRWSIANADAEQATQQLSGDISVPICAHDPDRLH
jgi:hypothetical protein